MSDVFITQEISDKPEVLVFGSASGMRKQIAKVISKNQLSAVECGVEELSKLSKDYYKALIIADPRVENSTQLLAKIGKISRVSKQVLVVVCGVSAAPELSEYNNWQNILDRQKTVLAELEEKHETASVVLVVDLIDENHPLLGSLKKQTTSGVWKATTDVLYASDISSIVEAMTPTLLAPWRDKVGITIVGRKQKLSDFLAILEEKLYRVIGQHITVEKHPASEQELDSIGTILSSKSKDNDIYLPLVQRLTKIKIQKKAFNQSASAELPRPKQEKTIAKPASTTVPLVAATPYQVKIPPTKKIRVRVEENRPKSRLKRKIEIAENGGEQLDSREVFQNKVEIESKARQSEKEITKSLQRLFETKEVDRKKTLVSGMVNDSKVMTTKNHRRSVFFWGGIFVSGLAITILMAVGGLLFSSYMTNKTTNQVVQNYGLQVEQKYLSRLARWNDILGAQMWLYTPIVGEGILYRQVETLSVSESVIESSRGVADLQKNAEQLFTTIITGSGTDVFVQLDKIVRDAEGLYQQLSLLQPIFEDEDNDLAPKESNLSQDALNESRQSLVGIQQAKPILEQILGSEGKKNVAILLQDNQELRPTGGFIQAVALLKFENGILVDSQVFSVYDLDKKLVGEVSPPEDLKQLLGEERLYIRDSNWNPDFSVSGKQLTQFLQRTIGQEVDLIAAVNLSVLSDLVEVVGPVDIKQYNEVVTHKNLWERAEFHSEVSFDDAQSSAPDYLTTFFSAFLNRIQLTLDQPASRFFGTLAKNLANGEIFLYSSDTGIQSSLSGLGWSGSLLSPDCPVQLSTADTCLVDSMAQIDTNVSVNKSNYAIKRTISHSIEVQDQGVAHRREIAYLNTAKTNSWPQGTYRDYIRFYVPENAQLSSVFINGQEQDLTSVTINQASGKQIWGMVVEVPVDSELLVELNYLNSFTNEEKLTNFSYTFFDQHQAGIVGETNISVSYPTNFIPKTIAPQANVVGNNIRFESNPGHQFIGVEFVRN